MTTPTPTLYAGPNPGYALGAKVGDLLFLSLHVGGDGLGNGREAPFDEQVRQAFGRLFDTLDRAGADRSAIAKLTIYLADIADFDAYNVIYRELMPEPRPARSTIQTPIGHGWRFAVDGVAVLP
ncbi:RidA family protein [Pseudonocardia pini]|uniref:RidA family protein n=1 Tax=Pseudonocardia pini TaxID=2758030 RepID=UPI0015F04FA4|nr:RidA family protein [Pseudonocardia pini]